MVLDWISLGDVTEEMEEINRIDNPRARYQGLNKVIEYVKTGVARAAIIPSFLVSLYCLGNHAFGDENSIYIGIASMFVCMASATYDAHLSRKREDELRLLVRKRTPI